MAQLAKEETAPCVALLQSNREGAANSQLPSRLFLCQELDLETMEKVLALLLLSSQEASHASQCGF